MSIHVKYNIVVYMSVYAKDISVVRISVQVRDISVVSMPVLRRLSVDCIGRLREYKRPTVQLRQDLHFKGRR
jgi:hypothetical protein